MQPIGDIISIYLGTWLCKRVRDKYKDHNNFTAYEVILIFRQVLAVLLAIILGLVLLSEVQITD